MTDDKMRMIKDKVEFFMNEKVKVHVSLIDKSFLNGYIEKKVRSGVYWFIDDKFTAGVFLFLGDIYEIDQFQEAGK